LHLKDNSLQETNIELFLAILKFRLLTPKDVTSPTFIYINYFRGAAW